MSDLMHTPGPWRSEWHKRYRQWNIFPANDQAVAAVTDLDGQIPREEAQANARLIAAAPTQYAEMVRHLPILERAEADPELWAKLTEGLGIATLNGYREAIAKAKGGAA